MASTSRSLVSPANELGPLIASYRGRRPGWLDVWTWILPGAAAVLAPAVYGQWRASYAYTNYGPVAAQFWSQPWYAASALALAVLAVLFLTRWMRWMRRVDVHQEGLHLRLSPLRSQKLPYSALAGIATDTIQERFLHLPLRTAYRAILFPSTGRPVRLDDSLTGLPELVTRVKASLYPRLIPTLEAEFQRGQWLRFGPLVVHQQELRLGRQRVRWQAVERLSVQAGCLVVELKNPSPGVQRSTLKIPVANVPNFEILLQLIQQGANL